jgi:hypothetical protein
MINACRTSDGNPDRKRPFGILRLRWENNIRMDLREMKLKYVD